MFKLLWSNPSPPKGGREGDKGQAVPDGDRLKMLAEHFSIGRKVRYFPEYQRDIVFHTIIIAWRVNDHYVYAREAIEKRRRGHAARASSSARRRPACHWARSSGCS
jgi:hypothetical protein